MILAVKVTHVTSDSLLMSKNINRVPACAVRKQEENTEAKKKSLTVAELFYFHCSLKAYDTPGVILSTIDCKSPLSVSLWQDWASAAATFTENNWDLEGLCFCFEAEKPEGGEFGKSAPLFDTWRDSEGIFIRLHSLQLQLEKKKKGQSCTFKKEKALAGPAFLCAALSTTSHAVGNHVAVDAGQ